MRWLFTVFHLQTDSQTKQQNSSLEVYLWVFVNFEQNDWAKLLPMAEVIYHNTNNASTGHTLFKPNCSYHLRVSFKEDINLHSRSNAADKLLAKLQKLMTIYKENLYHAQKLQKEVHNKGVKPKSYAPDDKIWLNSKYLKTKQNQKLKAKFFGPFLALHLVGKQAYKLEFSKKWKIYNVFYMLLLEQNKTRKERMDK